MGLRVVCFHFKDSFATGLMVEPSEAPTWVWTHVLMGKIGIVSKQGVSGNISALLGLN